MTYEVGTYKWEMNGSIKQEIFSLWAKLDFVNITSCASTRESTFKCQSTRLKVLLIIFA